MANRPARVCACGKRIASGQRCQCQKAREQERPSARKRGYDREWEIAAASFLREHPTCTCGRPAVLVRHRISVAMRPDLRMNRTNWLPGCRSCNARDIHDERRKTGGGHQLSAEGGRTARVTSAGKSQNGPRIEEVMF